MKNVFLAVDKRYLGQGLKSIDILILAQIEEFQRNGKECYLTNQQFSEMFGESESTIKRALDKLEGLNMIKRRTVFVDGNGRSTKQRVMFVCNGRFNMTRPNAMEGSNVDDGRFKNEEWKGHNDPIKDNKKINKKKKNDFYLYENDSLQQASDCKKKSINTIPEEHPSKPSNEELYKLGSPPHNRRRSLAELEDNTDIDEMPSDEELGLI